MIKHKKMALFANGMICLNLNNNENMKQKYVFWSKQKKEKVEDWILDQEGFTKTMVLLLFTQNFSNILIIKKIFFFFQNDKNIFLSCSEKILKLFQPFFILTSSV